MLQLHYYPSTASMAPHIVLQELGVPFELVLVEGWHGGCAQGARIPSTQPQWPDSGVDRWRPGAV